MSGNTRIWPSHAAEAPMPIVGVESIPVIFTASSSTTRLQHHAEAARLRHRDRIFDDRRPLGFIASLRLEAAKHMDRLWRQAHMGHHRHPAFGQEADRFRHAPSALELHGSAPGFLHDPHGRAQGLLAAFLIAAERQVHDDQRARRTPHYHRAMGDHQVQAHRNGRVEAVNDHAKAIANEQQVADLVGDPRGEHAIGGERDDGLGGFAAQDVDGRDAAGFRCRAPGRAPQPFRVG